MLLYKMLSQMCFQTSVLDQLLAAQQTANNILPSLVQSPAQPGTNENSITNNITTPITNINQSISNPNTGAPLGYVAISNYPIPVMKIDPSRDVQPNVALLYPNAVKVTATGSMGISIALDSSANPAYPLITRDNGVNWSELNLGQNLNPGTEYQFSVLLFPKDVFDISFSAVTTIRYMRIAYILSM